MAALSTEQLGIARKINSAILQRLASLGQSKVAATLEISESTVSRWKDGDIEKMAQTLAVLGLKVVPATSRCFEPTYIEALKMLARQALDSAEDQSLEWD
jgi:predicted XRE-type DNA-binding protein